MVWTRATKKRRPRVPWRPGQVLYLRPPRPTLPVAAPDGVAAPLGSLIAPAGASAGQDAAEAIVSAAPAGCGRPSGHPCSHADCRHLAMSAAGRTYYTRPVAAVARLASGGGAPPPMRQKRSLSLPPATAGLSTQKAARRRGQHGMRRRRRRDRGGRGGCPTSCHHGPRPGGGSRCESSARELSRRVAGEVPGSDSPGADRAWAWAQRPGRDKGAITMIALPTSYARAYGESPERRHWERD
jgi:hypothetical protein